MERELTSDESDERGTPHHRFALLLKHLDDRFPDKEWYSAQAPEGRYLAAIDALRSSLALKETEIERLTELLELHIKCLVGIKVSHPHLVPDELVKLVGKIEGD